MALRKELMSDKGIIGNYHRIESVNKNHDDLSVTIKTYVDESYRQKEKELLEMSKKKNDLISELSVLTVNPEENAQRISEINEEFEKYDNLAQIGDFSVFSTQITIPYNLENDISFSEIYKYLSAENTVFSGAEIAE